jgi:Peptidase family S41
MIKKLINFLLLYCIGCGTSAQKPFNNDFDYLSFTIKDTYAGYQDKVKGKEFDKLVNQVKKSSSKDTFALLSRMSSFFRDKHILLTDDEIANQKVDTLNCRKDSQMIREYFVNKCSKDEYEGYWISEYDYCIIAFKKIKTNPVTYYGYVVENKMKAISGYCILKMVRQKDGTYYTDYIDENLGYRAFLYTKFKSKKIFWGGTYAGRWRHIMDYKPGMLKSLTTFSYKPVFSQIDANTVMLGMYDFSAYNIKRYDSIIKVNKKAIDSATTLIVDIRNNPGGYIKNYLPLLPYIYTGPIVRSGGYTIVSDNYMKQHEEKIQNALSKGDTLSANKLIAFRDTFLLVKKGHPYYYDDDTLAKNLPMLAKPKNVAVIANNICMSAAELMLLHFRQSNKVKIFGEATYGAVDYLSAMSFILPHSKYSLTVPSAKRRVRINESSYDATGIAPDIEIGDNISDWIAFVKKYYDEHQ